MSPESQILDFGLARHADAEMTGYVVTRWYRAPEVILSWMHYNQTGQWPAAGEGLGLGLGSSLAAPQWPPLLPWVDCLLGRGQQPR